MEPVLKALCKQTISRYAYQSSNRYNDYTWAVAATTFLARIEQEHILIRNELGQEMLSTCQIYCDNDVTIDIRDKITSDFFDIDYPEILKIEKNPDEYGNLHHIVIYTK
jgi:hypothetical protein